MARVNLRRMTRDAVEKCVGIVENLVHLAVIQRGVEASGQPLGTAAGSAADLARDRPQRRFDACRGEPDRARNSTFNSRNSTMRRGRKSAV
jgi:hypothetical protein